MWNRTPRSGQSSRKLLIFIAALHFCVRQSKSRASLGLAVGEIEKQGEHGIVLTKFIKTYRTLITQTNFNQPKANPTDEVY